MNLDRAAFFAAIRLSPFAGKMNQVQVDGMTAILDAAPAALAPEPLAYCLATTFHETAKTMKPIMEIGGTAYFTRMYDPKGERPAVAKQLGNTVSGDGARFAGRGYVQLTGRANYAKAKAKTGVDLLEHPDRAMEPAVAARILFAGMAEGWFTGKRLIDFFGPGRSDPVGARRIINGLDKAEMIAGYHEAFVKALRAAQRAPEPVSPRVTVSCPTCGGTGRVAA